MSTLSYASFNERLCCRTCMDGSTDEDIEASGTSCDDLPGASQEEEDASVSFWPYKAETNVDPQSRRLKCS